MLHYFDKLRLARAITLLRNHEDDSPASRRPPLQHKERLVQGIQHARVAAFLAQHAQRVNHEIRVTSEVLVHLDLVAERDHRCGSSIRSQQLRKQNASAAQFIDHGSGIRAGLNRDYQVDRIGHPIHLYHLRHIVVVENQFFGG